jgi:hypothetical protein
MAMFPVNGPDPDEAKSMSEMFGPGQVDDQIRRAITFCWMMLPRDRKTVDELEKQIRRIVNRALKDLREDTEAFGLEKRTETGDLNSW